MIQRLSFHEVVEIVAVGQPWQSRSDAGRQQCERLSPGAP